MWRTVKLGDVCNISIGKTPSRSDKRYWDKEKQTDNVWLSIADLTSANGRYIWDSKEYVSKDGANLVKPVPKNTLVMSFKLSIGKLAFTQCELRTNEAIAALSVKDEMLISKEYLYHYLSSFNWNVIAGKDEKVKGKTLNKKKLNELKITFPPLAEQQRIVAKLDAAFAEIDRAVSSAKESTRLAEALLARTIVNLLATTKNAKFKSISSVAEMQSGYAFKSYDYSDESSDVKLLRGDNIAPNNIDLSNAKRLPDEIAKDYHKFELMLDDIVLAMDRPYISSGLRLAKVNHSHLPCLLVQRVMRLRAISEISSDFLHLVMETPNFLKHILGNQTGLGVPHISAGTIGSFEFELPDLSSQLHIIDKANFAKQLISKAKVSYEYRLENLVQLKSAILAQELQPPQSEAA